MIVILDRRHRTSYQVWLKWSTKLWRLWKESKERNLILTESTRAMSFCNRLAVSKGVHKHSLPSAAGFSPVEIARSSFFRNCCMQWSQEARINSIPQIGRTDLVVQPLTRVISETSKLFAVSFSFRYWKVTPVPIFFVHSSVNQNSPWWHLAAIPRLPPPA